MLTGYAADAYDFFAIIQDKPGPLLPPPGNGWILVQVSAAEDGDAAILLVTWARPKVSADVPTIQD
jgi:hypothetical protein